MRRVVPFAVALVLAALAAPTAARAQQGAGAILIRLGRDTVSGERYTRTATRLSGEGFTRQPTTTLRQFTIDFAADGRPTRGEIVVRRPGAPADAPPIQSAVATFSGDSVFLEVRRDTAVQRRRLAVGPGVVPLAGAAATTFASFELLTAAYLRSRADSLAVNAYYVGTGGRTAMSVKRLSADSLSLFDGNNTFHVRVDRDGRILGAVPVGGTQQFTVERVATLDVNALATQFAARDQQGQRLGQLSPRDTVRATVGGASLLVDYSRPSRRGRTIFGSTIVPWGEVWRTGANAATQFRTDRALDIGGVTLPAGFYTLWTIPTQAGWKLLVNSQTGQWGTAHDATRDLFQLDLTVRRLPQMVETFTIGIEPQGQGGVLKLQWENTEASIPFTVR